MIAKTDEIGGVLNTNKRGGRGGESKQRDGEEDKKLKNKRDGSGSED